MNTNYSHINLEHVLKTITKKCHDCKQASDRYQKGWDRIIIIIIHIFFFLLKGFYYKLKFFFINETL